MMLFHVFSRHLPATTRLPALTRTLPPATAFRSFSRILQPNPQTRLSHIVSRPSVAPKWQLVGVQKRGMKVRSSIKKLCEGCKIVRRKSGKYLYNICKKNPKHKQRQG